MISHAWKSNRKVMDNTSVSSDIKDQVIALIHAHRGLNQQKVIENWSKKETFFLTLQTKYLEKFANKSHPNLIKKWTMNL